MNALTFTNGMYRTAPLQHSFWEQRFPSLTLYRHLLREVFSASSKAKRGKYTRQDWVQSNFTVLRGIERAGVTVEVSGIEHVQPGQPPCVFIGNHMSMMETAILGGFIYPIKKVTFVVKQSLLDYPVFRHVMRSCDPVAVTRTNPREDLKAVLEGGQARLQQGISLIIFPQTTRTTHFDPEQFSTIGIKLAKHAQVPVIPIALCTDAWSNGKYLKDFGKIYPERTAYFCFGPPMTIQGRGNEEHEAIVQFITAKLQEWRGAPRAS